MALFSARAGKLVSQVTWRFLTMLGNLQLSSKVPSGNMTCQALGPWVWEGGFRARMFSEHRFRVMTDETLNSGFLLADRSLSWSILLDTNSPIHRNAGPYLAEYRRPPGLEGKPSQVCGHSP